MYSAVVLLALAGCAAASVIGINPNALPVPLDTAHVALAKNAQLIQQAAEGTRNILGGGVPAALPADTHEVAAGKVAHAIAVARQTAAVGAASHGVLGAGLVGAGLVGAPGLVGAGLVGAPALVGSGLVGAPGLIGASGLVGASGIVSPAGLIGPAGVVSASGLVGPAGVVGAGHGGLISPLGLGLRGHL
ncbi:hypothetical protein GE061_014752 [Apolygus lucorum]|uniref:Uncharacterized protein n=1 Tax=Apolygus lucorum TaxID=248454 RepID=A0A8S9XK75_APOLU|nr:hypothetical protein GE061_014752 [Apolygus lucorum]